MYDLAKQIDDISQKGEKKIVKDVSALIASILKILNDHSANETVTLSDGSKVSKRVVSRQKLRAILRDLRSLEKQTSQIIYDNTTSVVELSIIATLAYCMKEFKSITKDGSLTAKKYIDTPFSDGLLIKDRAEVQASKYTDEVMRRIRISINKGDTIIETMDDVSDVFNGKEWELRRIITSETFNSYRKKMGDIAEENNMEWIRIHESFPRHPRRRLHECFKYAHEDNYGKGKGVFKVTDEKIYSPHPQCTSWLELYELSDSFNDSSLSKTEIIDEEE